jgi:hypothetical protein
MDIRKEKLYQQIAALNKVLSKKDYEEKVPEPVRALNREKVKYIFTLSIIDLF